jgi:hypothetical protein
MEDIEDMEIHRQERYEDWAKEEMEQEQEEASWNQQLWNDIGYSNCL